MKLFLCLTLVVLGAALAAGAAVGLILLGVLYPLFFFSAVAVLFVACLFVVHRMEELMP